MEKRIFICQQCGAELCADEVDGMLGHAVPDFDNAGDVYGCNQCGPCEVVPDRAIAYIAALEQQLAAAQKNRCEHCGATIINNCPVCGAPQCCPQCCRIDQLEAQLAAE